MNRTVCCSALIAAALVAPTFAEEEVLDMVVKPGSLRGHVGVANCQKLIPESAFREAVEVLRENSRYAFAFSGDESSFRGAGVCLRIVDDPTDKAPMTVSPEIGRGVLNVAALTNDLKTTASVQKLLPKRAQLEFLRLVCYAFGAAGSRFDGNLLAATSLGELDKVGLFLPVDVFERLEKGGAQRGLKPEIVMEYRDACQEGWAPAPKNAEQKKIWDEVHAIPTAPIKIKFDKKTGQ